MTISARKLFEIVKELPTGDIELTATDNNWTTIQAGRSQFKIVAFPAPIIRRYRRSSERA
ncbi:MAG: hypothetical protein IPK92_15340 [Nitrospira sp.]|nr:hypothetical protein [Nitrospira sp.]